MAKVAIGIDLGTSNCALEWSRFDEGESNVSTFKIRQYETTERVSESEILPSFLYFPEKTEEGKPPYQVGKIARNLFNEAPSRCIHSAKSWLCHSGVDREGPILPWQSDKLNAAQRMSPVQASAAYLKFLKASWNAAFAEKDPELEFSKQQITVTVPASFDQVSQRLTLKAAQEAGYPESTRLLEEPQAAFLAWIQEAGNAERLEDLQNKKGQDALKIAVCDVGGGTTDFSLFSVDTSQSTAEPEIERLAVSDHILLGGDNIDIALAKRAEAEFSKEGTPVKPEQWLQLVAQARTAKEAALETDNPPDVVRIVLTGSSSSLFANTQSLTWQCADLTQWITDNFFPKVAADASPEAAADGFVEMGLPYAQEAAITVHLADFLKGQPIDAILFNGGTVSPDTLQKRICETITSWQDGDTPLQLSSKSPYLAVARGAAHYGHRLKASADTMIRAGAARPFLIEVQANEKASERHLLCLLPKGATPADTFTIKKPTFALRLDRPVQFQPFSGPDTDRMRQGQIVKWQPNTFHAMPPLQTLALSGDKPSLGTTHASTEISLQAQLNELGLVEVSCLSTAKKKQNARSRWDLAFDIRQVIASENQLSASHTRDSDVSEHLDIFTQSLSGGFTESILKNLEDATGKKRAEWSLPLLRSGFDLLIDNVSRRSQSENQETAWWMAAGYCLRPGFGAPLDDFRIQQVGTLYELGLSFPTSKAVREQSAVFWRRIAGGLSVAMQERIFKDLKDVIFSGTKRGLEPLKMAAAFEGLSAENKNELVAFLERSLKGAPRWASESYLWALGRVLARVPLSGKQDTVLPATHTESRIVPILESVKQSVSVSQLRFFILQTSRLSGVREFDLSEETRAQISEIAIDLGITEEALKPLKTFVPIAKQDMQSQFGESLPQGLVLV